MKTRTIHIFILIFVWNSISGQIATINNYVKTTDISIFISGKDTVDVRHGNKIIFPIIKTGDSKVDRRINYNIFASFIYNPNYAKYSLKQAIDSCVIEGLINMNYKVSYNNKGILSILIQYEHHGANTWINNDYLNFDLITGQMITINNIIMPDSLVKFKNLVLNDKVIKLNDYIDSLKGFSNKEAKNATIEGLKDCKKSVFLDQFKINEDDIEIFNKCDLPYYLSPYEPEIWTRYKFVDYSRFIRDDFKVKIK